MSESDAGQALTRQERTIMDLLHAEPGLSVGEINSRLEGKTSYSSTRAALARLVEKGSARFEKDGARYRYQAVASTRLAGRNAMRRVTETFFRGSRLDAISAMLAFSGDPLSDDEYERLLEIIEEKRRDETR